MRGGHEYQFPTHIYALLSVQGPGITHTHPGHFGTKQVFARLIPTSEAKAMYYLSDCLVLYVRKEAALSALEAPGAAEADSQDTRRRGTGLRGVTPSQVTSAAFLPISLPFQCAVCVSELGLGGGALHSGLCAHFIRLWNTEHMVPLGFRTSPVGGESNLKPGSHTMKDSETIEAMQSRFSAGGGGTWPAEKAPT